jgi:PTS system nitrogen regulatory IIA component
MKLAARDAARLLSISESELYRLVDAGTIPCHLVNRQPLFSQVELLEWATAEGRPLAPSAVFGNDAHPAILPEAIAAGGVHHELRGRDVSSVLAEVVQRLPIDDDEREMVLAIMLARESEATTAIGQGIAIPHVRMPLVFADHRAAITVCFLAEPVEFTKGGEPTHTVFAIVSPTVDIHLELLSRLAIALHDASFLAVIAARTATRDELVAAAQEVETRSRASGGTPSK